MIKRYYLILPLILLTFTFLNAQSGWFSLKSGTTNDLSNVGCLTARHVIAVGAAGTIIKTTDGGLNWRKINSGTIQNLNDISIIDSSTALVVGSGGTILRTSDAGLSWKSITSKVNDDLLSVSFNGLSGIAGGTSQTIIYSKDAGENWKISQTGFFGGGFWGVQMLDADHAIVAGENSIFQQLFGGSTNKGQYWNYKAFYMDGNEGRLYDVQFFDTNNGIAAASVWTGEGAIILTSDGGATWTTRPFFNNALYSLDFPADQNYIGYASGANGTIIKTTDGGRNWIAQQSRTTNTLYGIAFTDLQTGYAVGERGIILKTLSGGVIPVELKSFNAKIDGVEVRLTWITDTETNNSGFYVQRKTKNDWENLEFVQGNGTTTDSHDYDFLDNLSDLNYRGKIYYRLEQVDFDGSTSYSSTAEVTYEPKPNDYALDQNYPNPFNPITSIKFSIPRGSHVKLIVYDLLGNEVETLVDGFKPAGTYSVKFNGAELTSGIYIYRLQAGDFVSTKRMALIK